MGTVIRSAGVPIDTLGTATAGGGLSGATEELDRAVFLAGEALAQEWGHPVTIRFNSDRRAGGAWLMIDSEDRIGRNQEVGITYGLNYLAPDGRSMDLLSEEEFEENWPLRRLGGISGPVVTVAAVASVDCRHYRRAFDSLPEALIFLRQTFPFSAKALQETVSDERRSRTSRVVVHGGAGRADLRLPLLSDEGDMMRFTVEQAGETLGELAFNRSRRTFASTDLLGVTHPPRATAAQALSPLVEQSGQWHEG